MSPFEFNTTLQLRSDLQETLKITQQQLGSVGMQLGSWLVLGNVAGIYFLADAATHAFVATDERFVRLYVIFLGGTALAFGGICWTYFMSVPLLSMLTSLSTQLLLSAHREQIADDLQKAGAKFPEELEKLEAQWQAQMPIVNRRLARSWWIFGGAIGMFVLSAILFIVGISAPLWGGLAIVAKP